MVKIEAKFELLLNTLAHKYNACDEELKYLFNSVKNQSIKENINHPDSFIFKMIYKDLEKKKGLRFVEDIIGNKIRISDEFYLSDAKKDLEHMTTKFIKYKDIVMHYQYEKN